MRRYLPTTTDLHPRDAAADARMDADSAAVAFFVTEVERRLQQALAALASTEDEAATRIHQAAIELLRLRTVFGVMPDDDPEPRSTTRCPHGVLGDTPCLHCANEAAGLFVARWTEAMAKHADEATPYLTNDGYFCGNCGALLYEDGSAYSTCIECGFHADLSIATVEPDPTDDGDYEETGYCSSCGGTGGGGEYWGMPIPRCTACNGTGEVTASGDPAPIRRPRYDDAWEGEVLSGGTPAGHMLHTGRRPSTAGVLCSPDPASFSAGPGRSPFCLDPAYTSPSMHGGICHAPHGFGDNGAHSPVEYDSIDHASDCDAQPERPTTLPLCPHSRARVDRWLATDDIPF